MTKYKNLIVDGNNFLFRAFYVVKLMNKKREDDVDQQETDRAILIQFFKMLKNLVGQYPTDHIFFTWDKKINNTNSHNFRNDLADYKGQRESTDEITNVLLLHDKIQPILDAMGVTTVFPYNLEADDVINHLSKTLEGRNLIVSSDKDLLQLVNDNTDVLLPTKNLLVNVDNFTMNANISRDKFVLHKCILGDVSDNIKGLSGYGIVKATKLVNYLHDNNIFCMEDDKDNCLTVDQWMVIENNMKIIDLEYARTTFPDEFAMYNPQIKSSTFDRHLLKHLFEENRMVYFVNTFSEIIRLFDKTPLTNQENDISSILDALGIN